MNINLEIANFNYQLSELINSSSLDAGVIYHIVKNVCNEIEKQYHKIIQEEQKKLLSQTQELKE